MSCRKACRALRSRLRGYSRRLSLRVGQARAECLPSVQEARVHLHLPAPMHREKYRQTRKIDGRPSSEMLVPGGSRFQIWAWTLGHPRTHTHPAGVLSISTHTPSTQGHSGTVWSPAGRTPSALDSGWTCPVKSRRVSLGLSCQPSKCLGVLGICVSDVRILDVTVNQKATVRSVEHEGLGAEERRLRRAVRPAFLLKSAQDT